MNTQERRSNAQILIRPFQSKVAMITHYVLIIAIPVLYLCTNWYLPSAFLLVAVSIRTAAAILVERRLGKKDLRLP